MFFLFACFVLPNPESEKDRFPLIGLPLGLLLGSGVGLERAHGAIGKGTGTAAWHNAFASNKIRRAICSATQIPNMAIRAGCLDIEAPRDPARAFRLAARVPNSVGGAFYSVNGVRSQLGGGCVGAGIEFRAYPLAKFLIVFVLGILESLLHLEIAPDSPDILRRAGVSPFRTHDSLGIWFLRNDFVEDIESDAAADLGVAARFIDRGGAAP